MYLDHSLYIPAPGSLVSGERVASFALSCSVAPLMSIQMLLWNKSCPGLMPWLGSIYCVYKQGWFHWVAPIPCSICGGGALVGGCEVAMIFQSTYGVSVTFRVTPTWWVKCMFWWRTSPMVDRHSSLQEKKITSTMA